MSIRNLDRLFKARSVALVGASKEPRSVGATVAHNLFNSGFQGPVMPVNPRHPAIEGVLAYKDADDLPLAPDLAVIATPPPTVPGLIEAFARKGTRAAVVITAGFGEGGSAEGETLRRRMLEAARPFGLRIAGPNCIGVMVPGIGLNASFAHLAPLDGRLAFVAQSGAIVTTVLDWATARGIGFSHVVSLGDMADIDFGDMLDYLTQESEVRGILLYIEAVTNARKFMSAARAAARLKPVIVIKSGRFPQAAQAVSSHTGAMAGADQVYDAALRRAGTLRVRDIGDLFGAVETLGTGQAASGDRLAILTNGGGIGIVATDALLEAGGQLATLSETTLHRLDAVLPPTWSRGNPVDIIGDAPGRRYAQSLEILLQDDALDAVLVLNCPTAVGSPLEAADAVVAVIKNSQRCVLTCWLGEEAARAPRQLFAEHRVPSYFTPERAVRAFMHLVHYRRNQEALTQTPPSVPEAFTVDATAVRQIIARVLAEGREWLTEVEAKAVLDAYRVPVVPTRTAETAQQAAAAAAQMAGPVALKILSPDITHKSDVGGVALDLRAPSVVRDAAETMLRTVAAKVPEARVTGFTVQPMVERPGAFELIIGMHEDPQFGPVILFGHGGTATEIIGDTALALPPLNMHLAREAIARTRIFGLLKGYRGKPPAALDEIALTLIKISQLVIDFAEITDVDINPLLADEFGVLALDARLRVKPASGPAAARLAIRPYPKDLEERLTLPDERCYLLRPVLPEDEPAFQRLFAKLSPDEIRMRFFAPKRALTHPFAARLTQIDYDREMALVVADPGVAGQGEIYGAVHIAADPDGERAEFAILVRGDMAGLGLGPLLMRRIIDYSRARGIRRVFGEVLRENRTMLKLCDLFRFERHALVDDPSVIEVTLTL